MLRDGEKIEGFTTREQYLPLANEIWELISSKFPNPSVSDFGVMIGAMEAVKFGVRKVMKERGIRMEIMDTHPGQQ